MPVISTGQITITDFSDAVSLTAFISATQPKTQIYNPDNGTYVPNWTSGSTPMKLTPSLFVSGQAGDLIGSSNVQSITWYDAAAPNTPLTDGSTYGIPTSGVKTLTIKTNVLAGNVSSKDYVAVIVYRDPSTGLDLTVNASISLSKVVNGGGIADAIATTPQGNIFKNANATSLPAVCNLYRGSTIDTTSVSYQWYRQESAVTTDEGGGIGWRKLTSTINYGTTGYTTNTLTVPTNAVLNVETFKCVITDTDNTSTTYNQKFFDVVTFMDQSDPIQVMIESPGGTIFKVGSPNNSTTLRARLFQAGREVDGDGTGGYIYKWYKYDKAGNLVTGFGGTGVNYKTGKTLSVGDADVDSKATFQVEVEK